ncbi:three-helix bundle dimerization domain-containing protein [Mycobacterium kubicae]|uniref:three-helix bundle dimerization domain-containing protein n=1 Tax=Mycobacterium kubicae TaxID=120959 RepID=UPI001041DC68|nr:hypothetical protein [Mycobacterium kubicae]
MLFEDVLVIRIDEEQKMADVERRLTKSYGHLSADLVTAAVQDARMRYQDSPIRDYLPLLVERRARAELTEASKRTAPRQAPRRARQEFMENA